MARYLPRMSGGMKMRVPKYRAWYNGKMYEVAKLDLWGGPDQTTCELASLDFDGEELFDIYLHEVKIMQFTGLYDKNGKEIYEGDILKRTSTIKQWKRELFEEIIGKVTIKIGMTYLVGKRKHGYSDEELKISNCKELLLSPDLFEVIGDIHSNPELLESGE